MQWRIVTCLLSSYTLSSSSGRLVVRIINYGGVITEINVPDRDGKTADINLGFDNMTGAWMYCRERYAFSPLSTRGREQWVLTWLHISLFTHKQKEIFNEKNTFSNVFWHKIQK